MMGISSTDILRIVLYGIGLTSVCALVWLAGPLISIGGWRPLENYIVREIVILVLVAAFTSVVAYNWNRRKKATAKIAEGIATPDKVEDDADVLKDRMKDALATLKAASGGKSDFLYDLPWYLLIGPPGSGKTTALLNSGLKFPLSRGATPAVVAGVGGTRYCEWLFTEQAVLVDTAGRYTTHDSDTAADKASWLAFLDLLKKNRPRQPINGVLVGISLEDLMTLEPAEIATHANAIRARLLELHERLKVDFPVYAVFTKGDLVAGFAEYFASLSDQGRRQVWGATFQTNDKTRNLVGDIPKEFDDLIERLNEELTDRLQEEPTPSDRVLLYGFPTQMAGLKRPIFDFLNQIFEPTRYHANATLRGFYFTSGTQHGTPIDRLIGALARNFGAEQLGAQAYSGLGKSYFLTDLILKVIIGEAAWVSTDRAAVRRARIIKACLYATVALCAVGMTGLWWVSYTYNRELISSTQYTAANYEQEAGSLAHETIIGDHDMAKVRQPLFTLRNLPTGYENRKTSQPLLGTWGLSQRDRLRTSSEQVYHVGLERLSRPRLMFRLEEVLRAKVEEVLRGNRSNSGDIYEALKVYMMIAGVVRMEDRDLVISWMRNDWAEQLYLGAGNAEGRKALEAHLVAMLDLQLAGDDQPLVEPDLGLIAECQRILARQNIAERAYQLLKSQSRQSIAPDWVASEAGGPDFATVFEAASANGAEISVPGFYTYAGFQRAFIDKLPTIAEQLKRDNWVLGDVGKLEAITSQYGRLTGELLNIYERDFAAAWEQALNKLRLRSITADRPKYIVLSAAAAPTSPIRQLLESIVNETALTRERAPDKDKKEAPKPAPLSPRAGVPGAAVEARFKPFRQVLEGGGSQRTIDSFIGSLFEINNTLQRLNLNPDQKQQATAELRVKVATLRNHAELFPPPFREELSRWVRELEATVAGGTQAEIREDFANSVVPACREYVEGKYPLVRGAPREATPAEFGKVFGKDQVFDSFFERRLKSYVDTSKAIWTWKKDNPVSADFSPDTARQFQRARNIKDAFFGTGGLQPSFLMSVTPSPIGAGFKAKLVVNGTPVESPTQQSATAATPAAPPNPQTIPWVASPARSFIEIKADVGGQVVTAEGMPSGSPWSFFRLLDIVGSPKGNGAVAKYSGYGQVAEYQFTPQTLLNPLLLPDLREFKCPKVL